MHANTAEASLPKAKKAKPDVQRGAIKRTYSSGERKTETSISEFWPLTKPGCFGNYLHSLSTNSPLCLSW